MFAGILASPWVQTVLWPAIAQQIVAFVDRWDKDSEFQQKIRDAAAGVRIAQTEEESRAASKALRDALHRK